MRLPSKGISGGIVAIRSSSITAFMPASRVSLSGHSRKAKMTFSPFSAWAARKKSVTSPRGTSTPQASTSRLAPWSRNIGQAVNGDSPELIFPNGFDPREHLFHTEDIGEGEVVLMHDPLEVMLAWQNGIANGVSFLTETVLPHQLEILAAFMDKARCEQLELA